MTSQLISYCGLHCDECKAFKATLANDLDWKKQIAKHWTEELKIEMKPEDVDCCGCKSETISGWCRRACKVRPCAAQKGIDTCANCSEYQCETLKEFLKNEPDATRNLQEIRKTI